MLSAIILASGIYLQYGGETIRTIPLRLPSASGLCQQERELAAWAKYRVSQLIEARADIRAALLTENLAVENQRHDWCAPRYQLRKTIGPAGPVRMILMKR